MKQQLFMQPANGCMAATAKVKKREVARAKDLATRERVNFIISTEIMSELRDKSLKENIPMSRMVDEALTRYLMPVSATPVGTLEAGINLCHHLEFLLYRSFDSSFTQKFLELIQTYLDYFTFSSCLLKTPSNKSIVGAKVFSFVADTQQEALSKLLNEAFILENQQDVKILLDSQPIEL